MMMRRWQLAHGRHLDFGEKAVDVFYVTDLTHAKITSTARQLTIRKALLEVFEFEGARAASGRTKVPARA